MLKCVSIAVFGVYGILIDPGQPAIHRYYEQNEREYKNDARTHDQSLRNEFVMIVQ